MYEADVDLAGAMRAVLGEVHIQGYEDEQDLATLGPVVPSDGVNWVNGPDDLVDVDDLPPGTVLDFRSPAWSADANVGRTSSGTEVNVSLEGRHGAVQSTSCRPPTAGAAHCGYGENDAADCALGTDVKSIRQLYLRARKRGRRTAEKAKMWNQALDYKVDVGLSARWTTRIVVEDTESDAKDFERDDGGWGGSRRAGREEERLLLPLLRTLLDKGYRLIRWDGWCVHAQQPNSRRFHHCLQDAGVNHGLQRSDCCRIGRDAPGA